MTRYTEKQKLAAVTAYKKGAGGLRATASAHDVGVDSLSAWIAAYEANGKAGLVAKRRTIYDLDFKVKVLRRMQDDRTHNSSHVVVLDFVSIKASYALQAKKSFDCNSPLAIPADERNSDWRHRSSALSGHCLRQLRRRRACATRARHRRRRSQ